MPVRCSCGASRGGQAAVWRVAFLPERYLSSWINWRARRCGCRVVEVGAEIGEAGLRVEEQLIGDSEDRVADGDQGAFLVWSSHGPPVASAEKVVVLEAPYGRLAEGGADPGVAFAGGTGLDLAGWGFGGRRELGQRHQVPGAGEAGHLHADLGDQSGPRWGQISVSNPRADPAHARDRIQLLHWWANGASSSSIRPHPLPGSYRKIRARLRREHGVRVSGKRVLRLLRREGLWRRSGSAGGANHARMTAVIIPAGATSGDYDHLLQTAMAWVDAEWRRHPSPPAARHSGIHSLPIRPWHRSQLAAS